MAWILLACHVFWTDSWVVISPQWGTITGEVQAAYCQEGANVEVTISKRLQNGHTLIELPKSAGEWKVEAKKCWDAGVERHCDIP